MSSAQLFHSFFQKEPSITTSAHGRVNLIGEHTDYNNGFVLPSLISQSLQVSISLRDDDKIIGISSEFGELQSSISSSNDGTWLDFVRGAIYFCQNISPSIKGMEVAVSSSIPSGSGLSSSAALEIALLRAISQLKDLTIQSEEMAKIGQQIEHQFVGTQCGIMDQMASACGTFGQAIFLDCENLQTKSIPVFSHHSFVIFHSGSTRKLSHGKYNERKNETLKASEILEVSSLRHAVIDQLTKIEDPIINKRAKHIISENDRVLKAVSCLEQDDPISFGELMNLSHHSMRDDYEISSDELNQVVESANKNGALGARLTGAGFGGCVVILAANKELRSVSNSVLED
ncbi:MAG: galactokinase, partial [Alphaproteobacteria bacterium]